EPSRCSTVTAGSWISATLSSSTAATPSLTSGSNRKPPLPPNRRASDRKWHLRRRRSVRCNSSKQDCSPFLDLAQRLPTNELVRATLSDENSLSTQLEGRIRACGRLVTGLRVGKNHLRAGNQLVVPVSHHQNVK